MRSLLSPALLLLGLSAVSAPASAQTTGFPGVNDYTIAGLGSGSTSCTFLVPPLGGGWPLTVSTGIPALPVLFQVNLVGFVPGCVPGAFPLPPLPCLPFVAGHSIDLLLGPGSIPLITYATVSDPFGFATVFGPPIPIPLGLTVATQAYSIDPTCGGLVATQAYTLGI